METVSREQVGTSELALPPRVQEALGQLVGSAKEGLLALSVGVGLGVLAELMEEEVVEVVGRKGKHDSEDSAGRKRHSFRFTCANLGLLKPKVGAVDFRFIPLVERRSQRTRLSRCRSATVRRASPRSSSI